MLTKRPDFPIIVVGAVNPIDGSGYAWSNMMTPCSINAPGMARCAGRSGEDTYARGTGVVMAHVAGSALYFLSLENLVGNTLQHELAYSIIKRMGLDFINTRYLYFIYSRRCTWSFRQCLEYAQVWEFS